MPGVNIQVEYTRNISDVNGKYSIAVPNANVTLIFRL